MPMEKTFRERNLTVLATCTLVAMVIAILGTFQLANLPLIAGEKYTAIFSEAGGLKVGDPVEVAGVTVGKVKSLRLDHATVRVGFTVDGVAMGSATTATIKTGTLLGARYLALEPAGSGGLEGDEIPLARTTAPYNLTDSLSQVAAHTKQLDLEAVGQAMHTFSQTFRDTSDELGPAFAGVTALSRSISKRDSQLRELFRLAESVTGTFRERSDQIAKLIRSGNLILAELSARRAVIARLITSAHSLANEVSAVVTDNRAQLKPALVELNKLLVLLNKNQDNIQVAIRRASAFITGLGEGVAHGPWFTGHLDLAVGPAGLPVDPNSPPSTGGNRP